MQFFKLFMILFISTSLINNCSNPASDDKKEEKQFLKLTLNGGEYNNAQIEPELLKFPNSRACYFDTTNLTICNAMGGEITNMISCIIKFPGNETGTYSNEYGLYNFYIYIMLINLERSTMLLNHENHSLQITKYGNIGENVEGAFSGNFISRVIGVTETSSDTIAIEGSFKLIRAEDH